MNKQSLILIIVVAIIAAFVLLKGSLYVVDIREQVVVTQFGRPVRTVTEPGLYTKVPFIQTTRSFDKRALEWDGESSDILTRDKENIEVNTWALWKIVDPLKFYTALDAEYRGQGVLDEVIESSVKNIVSSYLLKEVVRDTNRKLLYTTKELQNTNRVSVIDKGRAKLMEEIKLTAGLQLEDRYGMQLIDVVIKHINYVSSVIPKIYDRMRSERLRIANKYESEGRKKEAEIVGSTKKELERIESEGYKIAKELMGAADAQAIKIYAEAYKKKPEFYSFLKTLETYKTTINDNTTLILNTDGDYFKYIENYQEDEK